MLSFCITQYDAMVVDCGNYRAFVYTVCQLCVCTFTDSFHLLGVVIHHEYNLPTFVIVRECWFHDNIGNPMIYLDDVIWFWGEKPHSMKFSISRGYCLHQRQFVEVCHSDLKQLNFGSRYYLSKDGSIYIYLSTLLGHFRISMKSFVILPS